MRMQPVQVREVGRRSLHHLTRSCSDLWNDLHRIRDILCTDNVGNWGFKLMSGLFAFFLYDPPDD